ncbi:MAG: formyltransferase [Planctomycetota bacterium]
MTRIVVFAYHSVGCAGLKALIASGDEIVRVITHKDKPNENLWFDSVADLARERSLPMDYAEDLSCEALKSTVRELNPDIVYSFYYRDILPDEVLRVPSLGAFNLHGSLLPRYRGRCPVNWVIVNKEKMTGVTLHWMVKKPDAGDMVAQEVVAIDPRETAHSLFLKMIPRVRALVEKFHPLIREGRAPRLPQDHAKATVYPGRKPKDGEIDWTQDAVTLDALVRAVTKPYPGAFFFMNNKKVFVWETEPETSTESQGAGVILSVDPLRIKAGRGALRIVEAEFEGGLPWVHEGVTLPGHSETGEASVSGATINGGSHG